MPFSNQQRETLLILATSSVTSGVNYGSPLVPNVEDLEPALREKRATFVTLLHDGELRGCIGSLQATDALGVDVAQNAYRAAFHDPRFPPLTANELPGLEIHISVLSPPEPMIVASEADLLKQLRPGIDGLILEDETRRSTFLPAVWESLPDPKDFVDHLKRKGGFLESTWPASIRVSRYTAESVP